MLISGGTGSGKTTLLNALVSLLPVGRRVISIEDTVELSLRRVNCLRLEARSLGDRGVTIRDLVRHALRHRPDHIVVREVRTIWNDRLAIVRSSCTSTRQGGRGRLRFAG